MSKSLTEKIQDKLEKYEKVIEILKRKPLLNLYLIIFISKDYNDYMSVYERYKFFTNDYSFVGGEENVALEDEYNLIKEVFKNV